MINTIDKDIASSTNTGRRITRIRTRRSIRVDIAIIRRKERLHGAIQERLDQIVVLGNDGRNLAWHQIQDGFSEETGSHAGREGSEINAERNEVVQALVVAWDCKGTGRGEESGNVDADVLESVGRGAAEPFFWEGLV